MGKKLMDTGIKPRVPSLSCQYSDPQSSTYTAQVVLNTPVTHLAVNQYVASEFIRVNQKIFFMKKEAMLSAFTDFKRYSILSQYN